jgi:signal transduction histidine kinase
VFRKKDISYKYCNSIGNSLDINEMMSEVVETFVLETDSMYGFFYIKRNSNSLPNISSFGDEIKIDINFVENKLKDLETFIHEYDENINVLFYKLEQGFSAFVYKVNIDLYGLLELFDSVKFKLNNSINNCYDFLLLEESNNQLLNHNNELEKQTIKLENEINLALNLNKEKEQQIIEQLKMSQMGELIGNIAHQWREPLSVISTAASGMKIKKELNILSDSDFISYSQSIVDNSIHLSNTIDEFRDYIKESHRKKEIIIQDRLQTALSLVESTFSFNGIKIVKGYIEKDDIHFKLVLGDLLQVLISILNNSKDALLINNIENKWIRYELFLIDINVLITIEDSAFGINDDIIEKIFNPNFTTKGKDNGTGIGLYSARDIIVNKLKGTLEVENTKNGAKFFIKFPLKKKDIIR